MGRPEPLHVRLAPGIAAAFTTRAGGASDAPYASLNLATHVGDDEAAVEANRKTIATSLGVDGLTFCEQVHGDAVATVTADDKGTTLPHSDGLVTTERNVPLAVLAADCVPVLLADARNGIVAAVHAGRRGLVQGVVEVAVGTMLDLGADRDAIVCAVGPAIGACCYEVGEDVRDEVVSALPMTKATTRDGRPALDLTAGVRHVLAREGVRSVTTVGGCTAHQPGSFFSHRRDGVTGRHAGIVWRT